VTLNDCASVNITDDLVVEDAENFNIAVTIGSITALGTATIVDNELGGSM
jgi:hypothetical protein